MDHYLITILYEKLNFIKNLDHIITKSDELKIIDAVKNGKTSVRLNFAFVEPCETFFLIVRRLGFYFPINKVRY